MPVGGRAFEIMEVLAQSAGKLVTKNELMDRIWPGAVVMNNTLQVHAAAARKALGPYRNLLKTESGRGYRLLGDWAVRRQDAARPPFGLQRMRVSGGSPVTNFPATVTRLVGRAAAAQRLRDLISAYRIVTLTGPGGIGKSTLALKAARRVLGEFADGGWLVELAPLSDQRLVPSVVASVLGLKVSEETNSTESVARAVGEQRLLLVLDNCEHVIDAAANLTETLVRLCPGVTILATSREVLRIAGEHVYRVPPLEVPPADIKEPDRILAHSAVELFIARTKALEADFAPRAGELPTIAAICRRLDGIPLAIEFAAAGAATLGIQQMALGLRDRFMQLTLGRRTAHAQQRTLRATLDWSYQLLSEAEQELLHRLAIFAGPFSLDAAFAVAAETMGHAKIADSLAGLVGKSLVFSITDRPAAEFRLLETVRVYAMDRLTESGGLAKVARRHAGYFLEALGDIDEERRSKAPEYLAASRRRADEVHVALEWAFSATGDTAIGWALTIASVPLWFALSQMAAARGYVERALTYAEAGSDVEMRLQIALGHTLWYTTPQSDALESAFARVLEIAEPIGATEAQIPALWGLWAARRGRGDYPAALETARLYAEAAANAGDAGAVHLGDRILGLTHHFMGHQTRAREFAERSLRQSRLLDPAAGIGFQVETPAAMGSLLARILWLSGFPDQARVAANEAVAAAAKSGHAFSLCYAVCLAGLPVALWTGDMREARRLLDLFIAHAGGIPRMEHRVPAFTRLLKLRDGDDGEVLIAWYIESHSDPALVPPFADVDANAHIGVPLPRAEPVGTTWNTPEVLRVDAELLLWHDASGAVTAAELKLLRALEAAREQSALSWELRVAVSLSKLWRRLGRTDEALRLLAATYGRFTEGFDTSDLARARSLMSDLESDSPAARGRDPA